MRSILGFVTLLLTLVAFGPSTALASGVWSAPTEIDSNGTGNGASVSCSSATFCVAVGESAGGSAYALYALTYNGTSWSPPTNIDSGGGSSSVSCSSPTFCAAVHNGDALTYNGTSWTATNIGGHPSTTRIGIGLNSVSCPSATFCAAVGGYNNGDVFIYNGTSWTKSWTGPTNIAINSSLTSVSCPSATFCVAVDAYGNAMTYNGTSWSAPTSIPGGYGGNSNSLSCASATFCVDVGGRSGTITYNGTSWSTSTSASTAEDVSCPSATFCGGVSVGDALTYNGTSWSAPTKIVLGAITANGPLSSVSCPSTTFCVAVGYNGHSEIAATYATAEASASVKIEKFKVTTRSLEVTIKTSRAGTVTVTGPGLKRTARTVAAGTRVMTVALTKAGKAERAGRKKIKLSVSLKTSTKTVSRSVEIKL
jgi:hypothetical protein